MINNEKIDQKLINYIEASLQARLVLSEFLCLDISGLDIQFALVEVLSISDHPPLSLIDHDLNADKIVSLLKSFDFKKFHPEILSEVILTESLLPEEFPRLLTEQTIRVKGEVWRIHKADPDLFPSNPHAHNCESGVVLHLGTGEMFDKSSKKSIGKIGCKKLLYIRSELKSLTLPPTDCK